MLSLVLATTITAIVLPLLLWKFSASRGPDLSHLPIINPDGSRFVNEATKLVQEGMAKFDKRPFRIATPQGEKIILDTSLVDVIKSDPRLNIDKFTQKGMFAHMWGFEVFAEMSRTSIMKDMVRISLTQNLSKVTKNLATEVSAVLEKRWTNSEEWHDTNLSVDVLKLVAVLSTRVFMGEELAHNEEWLDIAISFALSSFGAASALRAWPAPLRYLANIFLKSSRDLRASQKRARALIEPIVKARRIARTRPDYVPFNDSLEWLEDTAKGQPYDATLLQLSLTMAAIHTTADLAKQTLLCYALNPEIIPELRQEILEVLPTRGWDKMSLYKLQLLDSSIREAQRIKPIAMSALGRVVDEDFTLPDGTLLPKDSEVMVSSHSMWDAELHPEPMKYDAHRWLNIRCVPGRENRGQLVTTEPQHLAWGHGKHACPGRFFAANEVKVAAAYAVMNYDIRLKGDTPPQVKKFGFQLIPESNITIQVRRRKAEIDLDSLR